MCVQRGITSVGFVLHCPVIRRRGDERQTEIGKVLSGTIVIYEKSWLRGEGTGIAGGLPGSKKDWHVVFQGVFLCLNWAGLHQSSAQPPSGRGPGG